jgi:hypothetical protein
MLDVVYGTIFLRQYGTVKSTYPELALVCIDGTILNIQELVNEVCDCNTIGDAFA